MGPLAAVLSRRMLTRFPPRLAGFTRTLIQMSLNVAPSVLLAKALCALTWPRALGAAGSPRAVSMVRRVTEVHFEKFPLEKSSAKMGPAPDMTWIGSDVRLG